MTNSLRYSRRRGPRGGEAARFKKKLKGWPGFPTYDVLDFFTQSRKVASRGGKFSREQPPRREKSEMIRGARILFGRGHCGVKCSIFFSPNRVK